MLSLEEALARCNQEELVKGKIVYADNVPYSSKYINDNSEKSCLLKALEGLASQEDNKNSSAQISKFLMKYIFNDTEAEKVQIDDCDVDNLIELRLIADANSKYLERLDKLMFRIYFEKGRRELEGLVYEKYDRYDWAEGFIKKYEGDKTIIFQDESSDHNEKFGINQQNENDNKSYNTSTQETIEANWILQKFGG